jgi:hypothetical protein
MAHKSKAACVGSGAHVATDRSNFTSLEFDCTSNASQMARKQRVDHHRVIDMEESISFEPNPRQNFCDCDKVNVDLSRMSWS